MCRSPSHVLACAQAESQKRVDLGEQALTSATQHSLIPLKALPGLQQSPFLWVVHLQGVLGPGTLDQFWHRLGSDAALQLMHM